MNSGVFPCIMGATDGLSCTWGCRVLFMVDIGLAKILLSPTSIVENRRQFRPKSLQFSHCFHSQLLAPIYLHIDITEHQYNNIYVGHFRLTSRSSDVDCAIFWPKLAQICFNVAGPRVLLYMWTTLGSHPDQSMPACHISARTGSNMFQQRGAMCATLYVGHFRLTSRSVDANLPYFGQNRPKYVSTMVGHVCWTTCGPALVHLPNNHCLLCHIFAKDGPYLFCDIWAKCNINYMRQFRFTSVLSVPEECLRCRIIAWSGNEVFYFVLFILRIHFDVFLF